MCIICTPKLLVLTVLWLCYNVSYAKIHWTLEVLQCSRTPTTLFMLLCNIINWSTSLTLHLFMDYKLNQFSYVDTRWRTTVSVKSIWSFSSEQSISCDILVRLKIETDEIMWDDWFHLGYIYIVYTRLAVKSEMFSEDGGRAYKDIHSKSVKETNGKQLKDVQATFKTTIREENIILSSSGMGEGSEGDLRKVLVPRIC